MTCGIFSDCNDDSHHPRTWIKEKEMMMFQKFVWAKIITLLIFQKTHHVMNRILICILYISLTLSIKQAYQSWLCFDKTSLDFWRKKTINIKAVNYWRRKKNSEVSESFWILRHQPKKTLKCIVFGGNLAHTKISQSGSSGIFRISKFTKLWCPKSADDLVPFVHFTGWPVVNQHRAIFQIF